MNRVMPSITRSPALVRQHLGLNRRAEAVAIALRKQLLKR